jgi:hypothetical protein
MLTRTLTDTAPPAVTGQTVYRFAHLCGAVQDGLLEQAIPREDVDDLIAALLPHLDRVQRDRLWDRARTDAAALAQAERQDTWEWPLCDMGAPDPRNRGQWAEFVCELELSVHDWIAEAHR